MRPTTPPTFIFSIVGAAIEEGSLKPGDRLLEVNDKCVDGMSQSDVVTLLRNVPLDSSVNLLVSRHSSAADGSDVADGAAPPAAAGKSPTKLKNSDANSGITSSEQGGGGGGPLVVPTRKLQFQLDEKTDEEVIKRENLG